MKNAVELKRFKTKLLESLTFENLQYSPDCWVSQKLRPKQLIKTGPPVRQNTLSPILLSCYGG